MTLVFAKGMIPFYLLFFLPYDQFIIIKLFLEQLKRQYSRDIIGRTANVAFKYRRYIFTHAKQKEKKTQIN